MIEVFPVVEVEVELPVEAAEEELIDLPIEEPEPEEVLLVRMPRRAWHASFAARAESVVAAGRAALPVLRRADRPRRPPVPPRQRLPPHAATVTDILTPASLLDGRAGRARPDHARLEPHLPAPARRRRRVQCVYKPVSGERPLWDFTDGTLAAREYAACVVSDALGWDVVPPTVLRDGPAGRGMVQLWLEPDPGSPDPVDVVPEGAVPDRATCTSSTRSTTATEPVSLVHEDTAPLRRMAVFDVVVNNTDRKGGHVLAMADGHRYGVDHGVCFHAEDKLRTVLWGWAGDAALRRGARRLSSARCDRLDGDLRERLEDLLTVREVEATARRVRAAAAEAAASRCPAGGWPSIPWPPF